MKGFQRRLGGLWGPGKRTPSRARHSSGEEIFTHAVQTGGQIVRFGDRFAVDPALAWQSILVSAMPPHACKTRDGGFFAGAGFAHPINPNSPGKKFELRPTCPAKLRRKKQTAAFGLDHQGPGLNIRSSDIPDWLVNYLLFFKVRVLAFLSNNPLLRS